MANSGKRSSLGRGFDSLIPTNFALNDVASPGEQIKKISLDQIQPNPEQPRKTFDEQSLVEMANSIKNHGVIQPIVITPTNDGANNSYRIVAGERRYRASKLAGLDKIPAIIRNHKELEELEISIVENVQRVDLSPLEQAVSIVKLRDQFSLTPKQIAQKLGKAETTISNITRLLQLPAEAVEALQKNLITEGHARTLLSLKRDEEAQLELLNKIVTQNLNVREAEKLVQQKKGIKSNKKTDLDPRINEMLGTLRKPIGKSVQVRQKTNSSGIIQISYASIDELENYLKNINR